MYALARLEGNKKTQLFKIKPSGSTYVGVLADHTRWSGETVKISAKEIVLHLGEDFPLGKVYNVWVEPVIKRRNVKNYGEIFFYSNPDEKTEQRICRSLVEGLKFIRGLGPQVDWEYITEIRNPKDEKTLGTYRYKSRSFDTLTEYDWDGQELQDKISIVAHEFGHGMWFRYLTAEERADWVELYERFVEVKTVVPTQIKNMIKDVRQIGSIKNYNKEAEPEEVIALQIFMAWLKKIHNLSRYSFQDLLTVNGKIPLPDTHLHRGDVPEIPVTLYSKKSAEELFCEAIGSYAVDALNSKLMIKMIKNLR
jgi:hypothetical protein